MRLTKLSFHRAGLWRDFGPHRLGPRITLVLGDNEAGKSTARRAIEAVLFGATRELAAPLKVAEFRVEAEAVLDDGSTLAWTRRGTTVEPREHAELLLREVPESHRARFRDLFRLGTSDVRADAAAFLGPQGVVGTMLMAAESGVGAARLAELEKRLESKLKELTSSRSAGTGLGKLLVDYKQGRETQREKDRFHAHDALAAERRLLVDRRSEAAKALERRKNERATLQRWLDGLSDHRRHAELLVARRRLEELGTIPDAAWATEMERGLADLESLEKTSLDLDARVHAAESAAESLPRALPIARHATAAQELGGSVARYEDDGVQLAADREARAKRLAELRRELEDLLHVPTDDARLLEVARAALLEPNRRRRLSERAERGQQRIDELRRCEQACVEGERERHEAEAARARQPQLELQGLELAREQLVALRKLEDALAERTNELGKLDAELERRSAQLGLGGRDGGAILALPIGDGMRFRDAEARHEDARRRLDEARRNHETTAEKLERARERLERQRAEAGHPPTLELLTEARRERDAVVDALADAPEPLASRQRGEALRVGIRRADEVADVRFTHAHQLGAIEQQERELGLLRAELEENSERLRRAEEAEAEARAERHQAWEFLAAPPAAADAWVSGYQELVVRLAVRAELAATVATASREREARGADVAVLLRAHLAEAAELGSEAALGSLDLEIRRRREANELAAKVRTKAEAASERASAARRSVDDARRELETWREEWAADCLDLPEPCRTDLAEVRRFLELQGAIRSLLDEIARLDRELERRAGERAAFEQRVRELRQAMLDASEGKLALVAEPVSTCVAAMREACLEAVRNERELDLAHERLEHARRDAETARERIDRLRAELSARHAELDPKSPFSVEAVRVVLERASRAAELDPELARLGARLSTLWPEGLDAALAGIAGRSESELAAEIATLEASLELDAKDLQDLSESVGAADGQLRRHEASSGAGASAQALALQRAQVIARANDAASLAAAIWLLQQARARATDDAHPLLAIASEYFARLTEGAYTGLAIERDAEVPTLVALDAHGDAKDPGELSDGTHDQIWLALRLAVVRRQAEEVRLPLILDDVFVQFDDGRTRAALRLLQELSEHVQVVVFTHHDHLVHLAREAIAPEYLAEVVLARPSASAAAREVAASRPSIDRPEAPPRVEPGEARASGPRRGQDDEALTERVLATLAQAPDAMSKNELFEALPDDASELDKRWSTLAKRLKDEGKIVQEGEKRGARYRIVGS